MFYILIQHHFFIRKILISIPSQVFLQCPHHSHFHPCGGCYHRMQPVVQHLICQQQLYCRIPQKPLSGPVEPKKRGVQTKKIEQGLNIQYSPIQTLLNKLWFENKSFTCATYLSRSLFIFLIRTWRPHNSIKLLNLLQYSKKTDHAD